MPVTQAGGSGYGQVICRRRQRERQYHAHDATDLFYPLASSLSMPFRLAATVAGGLRNAD